MPGGPKAQDKPAQGNALGNRWPTGQALKGRDIRGPAMSRPFRAFPLRQKPRALPWAGLFRAFGPTAFSMRNWYYALIPPERAALGERLSYGTTGNPAAFAIVACR